MQQNTLNKTHKFKTSNNQLIEELTTLNDEVKMSFKLNPNEEFYEIEENENENSGTDSENDNIKKEVDPFKSN